MLVYLLFSGFTFVCVLWSIPFTLFPSFVTFLSLFVDPYPLSNLYFAPPSTSNPDLSYFNSISSPTPTFHFVYPLKQVIQDNLPPSASLFIGNKTVGSGAFLSQQSASSSWRKSAGFHHGRTSLSKRYKKIYQHPCSFPLIWSWKPGPLTVCPPTERAISEFHFPPTCWFL